MVVGRISLLQHPITNELSAVDAIQLSHRCDAYPRVVVANKRCRMRTVILFFCRSKGESWTTTTASFPAQF